MTWENWYSPGAERIGDTIVRRFPVDQPRDVGAFNQLSSRLALKQSRASLEEQENWMRAQGPLSTQLLDYLKLEGDNYDAFIFFTYLYATTYFGLPLVRDKAYLAPVAYDEWPIYFSMWDRFITLPQAIIFNTPEEKAFFKRRFPSYHGDDPVVGVGLGKPPSADVVGFREKYSLTGPFLLYVGRIDACKGCSEMIDAFCRFNRNAGFRHKLVLIGKEVMPVRFDDKIIHLGFVSDQEKWNAMAACDWLLLPSKYESLSMALLETWAAGRPALVNGQSEVLVGHCRRSNGGLWYDSWSECELIVSALDEKTKRTLGAQGRTYVQKNYSWDRVERDYLAALAGTPTR